MDQERRRSPVSARIVHAAIAFTPGTMTSLLGIGRIIARLSAYRNASWGKEHNSEEHDYFPEPRTAFDITRRNVAGLRRPASV